MGWREYIALQLRHFELKGEKEKMYFNPSIMQAKVFRFSLTMI
jgi:hypothetical protein